MNKILLVEDGEHKCSAVVRLLKKSFPDLKIITAKSMHSAKSILIREDFDFAIFDMTLPKYDQIDSEINQDYKKFGGKELARQMFRKGNKKPFVYLTQFPYISDSNGNITHEELDREAKRIFPEFYRGLVYYDQSSNGWKDKLKEAVFAK